MSARVPKTYTTYEIANGNELEVGDTYVEFYDHPLGNGENEIGTLGPRWNKLIALDGSHGRGWYNGDGSFKRPGDHSIVIIRVGE